LKAMNIELTKWQTKILTPLFETAKAAFNNGNPVGIFAQIWENKDEGELGFMEVRVVDGKTCSAIQSLNGVKKGKMPDDKTRTVTIFQPDDNKPPDADTKSREL